MAPTVVRRAPYKDFLQPALHRRFSSTALFLLAVAYIEAILLAPWNSYLWIWFPLGPSGFRALTLFICGLAILVLRIAHYHVGLRTTGPGWRTLSGSFSSLSTYETFFWYIVSASVFSLVFIQSFGEGWNLRWVNYYSGDRVRLNERPIYLVFSMIVQAVYETIRHYLKDTDHLPLVQAIGPKNKDNKKSSPAWLVLQQLPYRLFICFQMSTLGLILSFALYHTLMRSFAWSWALLVFRPFYNLRKNNMHPIDFPHSLWSALANLIAATMLSFLWEAGNVAFTAFMVQPPLKNGNPLTFESKDPNGSLLNGLKSKKASIKSFAIWELAHIAEHVEPRRQAIFQDIDRKDGPMWSQVYGICMDAVKSIETRVDEYGKPPVPAGLPSKPAEEQKQRVSAVPKDDNVFSKALTSSPVRDSATKLVRHLSNSPGLPPSSTVRPYAEKAYGGAKQAVLSREAQARTQVQQFILGFMNFEFVKLVMQQDFNTQFTGVVLGSPYAEATLYKHAIVALCEFAKSSLTEDQFGNVHRDVASIVRALTAVIKKVEALKDKFPVHWTDGASTKQCPEVDLVLNAARIGLRGVVQTFEPYSRDLRLSMTDIRLAKEAAPEQEKDGPEMEQVN